MLNIAILGPLDRLDLIDQYLNDFFKEVKTFKIEFSTTAQVPSIIQYLQVQESYFDAVIFSGKIPYDIINHAMHSKNPWVYIDKSHYQLQSLLLGIALKGDFDPLNISIDCFGEKAITKAFTEVNIMPNQYRFYAMEPDIFKSDFIEDIIKFHRHNYWKNKVSVCITEITSVYDTLRNDGIPCILSLPSRDDLHNAAQKLELKIRSRINASSQIIAIAIEIDLPNEYSLLLENDYQMMAEKIKVTEKIYLFAQRIQATVVEIGKRGYLLFSTKTILENETQNLHHMALLDDISSTTMSTISLGIGYGITAREANYNANLGMIKAQKGGGNLCFAVNEGNFIGPILNTIRTKDSNNTKIDNNFLTISEATGIGIDTIFKIQCFIDQQKNIFTPNELAAYLEISKRSVDRILDRLESCGYMKIIGKKSESGYGRPSRIVKISFD